jgi:hypothetical protein
MAGAQWLGRLRMIEIIFWLAVGYIGAVAVLFSIGYVCELIDTWRHCYIALR